MILKKLLPRAMAAGLTALAVSSPTALRAEDDAYNANDLLLFLQNPSGTTGTDQVVYYSLGSALDVFRDAPSGTVTPLGNIGAKLTEVFGTDWTNKAGTIFAGAAGQNGATSALSTAITNGDYARTVYVTKPRSSATNVGKPNSASPLFDPAQTAVASNIAGANNIGGMTQPGAVDFGSTTIDTYNPFSNGNPSTAYGALPGGIQVGLATPATFGDVGDVVAMLDLYRVTKTTGTNADDASIWHNANSIQVTYSNNTYPGSNGARADFLGTITLGSDGAVNFRSKGQPGPLFLSAVSLPHGGEILSYAGGKLLSTNSGNGAHAVQLYAIEGNGALSESGSVDLSIAFEGIEKNDSAYGANDLLLFFQNPQGTVGTDQVVYYSLGSAIDTFRDAQFRYVRLGNVGDKLAEVFGDDWTNKAATIFAGAAGQNGPTSALSTAITNGDYARTVYVTKPRSSAGTEGQANSASPLFDPAQTAVAGNIAGANNISGMTQPGAVGFGTTTIDTYNPFSNGNPSTAYGALAGGIQGKLSPMTIGGDATVVALDLYRVTKTTGTNATDSSLWHIANGIEATYSNNSYPNSNGARADYLGTIIVKDDGEVGFFSALAGEPIYSVSSVVADSRGFAVAAVIPQDPATKGRVVFFSTTNGSTLNTLEVGYHPDCVTITPDGTKVLVANEAELRIDGNDNLVASSLENPGSISVIEIGNGSGVAALTQDAVSTYTFEEGNLAAGVTIAGLRNARLDTLTEKTPDYRDIEPEYITATNEAAYITLQENNAIAVFDFATSKYSAIHELGTIEQLIDASDRDGDAASKLISISTSVHGLPMPDTITKFSRNGMLYLATANEGDARPDDGDIARGSTLTASMTGEVAATANNTGIGRLDLLKFEGDTTGDGLIDTPIMLGTRSFTIWNASTGELVWDSGSQIEEFVAENDERTFNMNSGDLTNWDTRSDAKGPEPEAIAYASFGGKDYIFLGAERQNGIFQFDITDLENIQLVGYRNTIPNIYSESAALISPESILFIPASENPTNAPLIVVGYEGTGAANGSIGVFQVGETDEQILVAPVINSAISASGTVGAAFSYTITGTNSPTSYSAAGLPGGLTINTGSGVISGTPTSAGTSTVTIGATNAAGTGSTSLEITITAASSGGSGGGGGGSTSSSQVQKKAKKGSSAKKSSAKKSSAKKSSAKKSSGKKSGGKKKAKK